MFTVVVQECPDRKDLSAPKATEENQVSKETEEKMESRDRRY